MPPYKRIGRKFEYVVKPRIIIWINLVDIESHLLYTKIQLQRSLGSREEAFLVFFQP